MFYRLAADGLVLFHLSFIVFVMVGGLLLLRWPRLCWLHLPAVAWGILVELLHLPCPLTEWENRLRAAAGHRFGQPAADRGAQADRHGCG